MTHLPAGWRFNSVTGAGRIIGLPIGDHISTTAFR